MKAEELNKLMEAYNSMYAPKEEVVESEQLEEGMGLVTGTAKAINTVLKPAGQTPEQGKEAVRNLTKAMDVVAKPIKTGIKAVLSTGGKPITAGGGTPDTQRIDNEARRLGKDAMRRSGKYEDADLFDIVKGHLMSEGLTEEEALQKMITMTEEERQSIVEQYPVGFRPDGRYQNADGSHTGPVMGALKSIFSGNLPKSKTVIPPTPQPKITVTQTKKPVKPTPFSKGEDGKLTDFGAGGGDEKMRRTGMSVAEVEALGRKNKAAKGPKPYEQGGPRLPGRDM